MEGKEYLISNQKFYLKEYGELTGFDEEKIDQFLSRTGDEEISLTGYEIFPIILTGNCNPDEFDWKHLKNKQVAEILVDFLIEKKTSMNTMQNYIQELAKKRLQQLENTNQSMEEQELASKED